MAIMMPMFKGLVFFLILEGIAAMDFTPLRKGAGESNFKRAKAGGLFVAAAASTAASKKGGGKTLKKGGEKTKKTKT